jgi:hypothetical protein
MVLLLLMWRTIFCSVVFVSLITWQCRSKASIQIYHSSFSDMVCTFILYFAFSQVLRPGASYLARQLRCLLAQNSYRCASLGSSQVRFLQDPAFWVHTVPYSQLLIFIIATACGAETLVK